MDIDFLLVQKMRMGDERAIETFVKKYYPKILTYCRMHLDDDGYAEDMTQETFVRFFRNLKQYQHYGKAVNYLYVIAGNVCRDYYRKNKEIPVEQIAESADCGTEHLDGKIDIQAALDGLPDEIREVAVLFFVQERRQKEIARILGIGLPLVKYRIRKARELLLAYLGKEDV